MLHAARERCFFCSACRQEKPRQRDQMALPGMHEHSGADASRCVVHGKLSSIHVTDAADGIPSTAKRQRRESHLPTCERCLPASKNDMQSCSSRAVNAAAKYPALFLSVLTTYLFMIFLRRLNSVIPLENMLQSRPGWRPNRPFSVVMRNFAGWRVQRLVRPRGCPRTLRAEIG